ncbi:hypothetical protein AB6T38_02725 [Aliiglaciecola sp. SL4]|uniref:hypothetical protein n=1 Tax=Aliiglaciecola sp. SL4 TaxID=3239806 RepID=UPI00355C569C
MSELYYDPVIGCFYRIDPVGYTASNPVMFFNCYLHVNNNPYKYTYPDGVKSAALITVDRVVVTDNALNTSFKVADSIVSNAQTSTVNNVISGVTNNSKLGQIAEIGVNPYTEIS